MSPYTKPHKNKCNKLLIFILLISLVMLSTGIYLMHIKSPKAIYGKTLDYITNNIKSYETINESLGIKETYSLASSIDKIITTSKNKLTTKDEVKSKINIKRDIEQEKLLLEINKEDNDITSNNKCIIEDATEYIYLDNNYINNGTNNYFETFASNKTARENINYLITTINNSIKNNLKDKYFKTEEVKVNNKRFTKIELNLNNKNYQEIRIQILKDINSNKQAKTLISYVDEDYLKDKINSKNKKLNKDIKINIYISNFSNIKYIEYISIYKDKTNKIIHNLDNKETNIFRDNNLLYRVVNESTNTYVILDNNDIKIGRISFHKDNKRRTIILNSNKKSYVEEFIFDSKISNISKNKSFNNNMNILIKTNKNNETKEYNIKVKSKITTDATIKEDTTNAKLRCMITKDEEDKLNNNINNIKYRRK